METPKFNNKPNPHVKYFFSDERGTKVQQDFFVSRSIAVVGIVFAFTAEGMQVLISQRSKTMRDEPNKFGLPCGYLDWDETRHEAMIREVYEETSLYLPEYEKYQMFNNEGKSIISKDNPKTDKRQNVSEIYLTTFNFIKEPEAFPKSIEAFKCGETALVKWMGLEEFYTTHMNYEWAFNHDETIKSAVDFHTKMFMERGITI